MSGIQTISKKDWIYITRERELNRPEAESGELYIPKNMLQKMKQNPENII